jgi:hypothetical protein
MSAKVIFYADCMIGEEQIKNKKKTILNSYYLQNTGNSKIMTLISHIYV